MKIKNIGKFSNKINKWIEYIKMKLSVRCGTINQKIINK